MIEFYHFNMKKLILFLAITSFFACDKVDEILIRGFDQNTLFEFSVFNSQDVDLLDPTTPNHLEEDDIKIFYEIDGKMIEVYESHLDHPRKLFIFEHENEYRIRVFLNHSDTSDEPITYIQWNDDDTDTVKATFERAKNYLRISKVWLNDTEIWDMSSGWENQHFKLIK